MKKLMIVAAVALAAIASQAANVKWTTDVLYSPDATGAFTSTVLGKDTAKTWSASVVMTFFDATGNEITSLTGGTSSDAVSSKNGKMTATTAGYDFLLDTDYSVSASYQLTYDGKNYTMDVDPVAFKPTKATGDFAVSVPTASKWTVQGVPEPTSGLLLLLGVAGLALRRRRA